MSSRPVELFGLAIAAMISRQMQVLDELDDVNAAALEHRPVVEVDLVELQLLELLLHGFRPARKEARAHPVRLGAEAQVEARRLELGLAQLLGRPQHVAVHELADFLARQEPGLAGEKARAGTPLAAEIFIAGHDELRAGAGDHHR